jgi:hypothetical protein
MISIFKRWLRRKLTRKQPIRMRALLRLEDLEDRIVPTNAIVTENQLPGTPQSTWDISGSGDPTIQGFTTDISYNAGSTVQFKISTPSTHYRLDIYRMGYYQGNGARLVTSIDVSRPSPQVQPAPFTNSDGVYDCGDWGVSTSWAIPTTAVSGIYFAKAVREDAQDPGGASHIAFIVRNDSSHSDLLFKTSDATWEAYNNYGGVGTSFYGSSIVNDGSSANRGDQISYNRPFDTRANTLTNSWVFHEEYPTVRFLEQNGYDVTYFTDVDTARSGPLIQNHKVFMSVGHDEYWSAEEYNNVMAARDAGVNLAFMSGNTVFWKTRWANSNDGTNTPYRTLICYKESLGDRTDPADPPTATAAWMDPRYGAPADGNRPENQLTGTVFMVDAVDASSNFFSITVPYADAGLRFWRNTSVASLQPGQIATLAAGTLGYEFDGDVDNGFRPAGEIDMSATTVSVQQHVLNGTLAEAPGTVTHSVTLYRASSGALVFSAGDVRWVWGLDGHHDGPAVGPDANIQQATVNLFADMGVQPGSLMSGMVAATASTNHTPPTSTITAFGYPLLRAGSAYTITGTATDQFGVVAGVEVSVDGGTTWHPATGGASWSYTWTPAAAGSYTIRSRAADDSVNVETPSAGLTVSVVSGTNLPPQIAAISARAVSGQSVTVTWGTDEPANSSVNYGTSPTSLTQTASNSSLVTAHSVTLTGLTPNTTYYFRVTSTDASNHSTTAPANGTQPNSIFVPFAMDNNVATFSAGTLSNTYVTRTVNGEVTLAPTAGSEFTGTTLSPGWFSTPWSSGGIATVGNNQLTVTGARVGTTALYGPGSTLQFIATFSGKPFQNIGFGIDFNSGPLASFSPDSKGVMHVTSAGSTTADTVISGNYIGSAHLYRIDWTSTGFTYWIDGTQVATQPIVITSGMRPLISDFNTGGTGITVSWMRMSPYASAGTYLSRVFDAGSAVRWTMAWDSTIPANTGLAMSVRMGNTPTPDSTWTAFVPFTSSGQSTTGPARYFQYQAAFTTSDPRQTAVLQDVSLTYTTGPDTTPPLVTAIIPASGSTGASVTAPFQVVFSEFMNPATINSTNITLGVAGATNPTPVAEVVTYAGSTATIQPSAPLAYGTTYTVTVSGSVTDTSGNALGGNVTSSFTTRAFDSVTDTTVADFSAGTQSSTYVSHTTDGEVILAPTAGTEFSGTALPTGWFSAVWNTGGTATVANSQLTVNGARAGTNALYGPGSSLQFVATFGNDPNQNIGFGTDFNNGPWATFSPDSSGNLHVNTQSTGSAKADTVIPGNYIGSAHLYRIDWTSTGFTYSIDGVQVATHQVAVTSGMRPLVSDYTVGSGFTVNWMRLSPYAATGTFQSRIINAGNSVTWRNATWDSVTPANTSLAILARVGSTATPDSTWTSWLPVASSGGAISAVGRDLQYEAVLSTTDSTQTPALQDITFTYNTAADTSAPRVVSQSPAPGATGVSIAAPVLVTFSKQMNASTINSSTVTLQASGSSTPVAATVTYSGSTATLQPNAPLAYNTTYTVTVSGSITDTNGNAIGSNTTWSFTTRPFDTITDTAVADFSAGTLSNTYVSHTTDGEVILAPTAGSEFGGTSLPTGWFGTAWNAGGTATVANNQLTVNGARAGTNTLYGPGSSLQFVATFSGKQYQTIGLGIDFNNPPLAAFSPDANGVMHVTSAGGTTADTVISGNYIGTAHLYRIDWTGTGVTYWIDGTQVATHQVPISSSMRPLVSDFNVGGTGLTVNWMRLSPYAASGTFQSRIIDAGSAVTWRSVSWDSITPANTSLIISVRMGNTATPDSTWTGWSPQSTSGATVGGVARYLQYQVALSTTDLTQTPALQDITFAYNNAPDTTPPRIVGQSPAPGATGVSNGSAVVVTFSKLMKASTITTSTITLQASGSSTPVAATVTYSGSTATLQPTSPLTFGTTYTVTVSGTITDVSGNALGSTTTWTFTTSAKAWRQSTASDFNAGSNSGTTVSTIAGGKVQLAPAFSDDFTGTTLSSAWTTSATGGGTASATVANSILALSAVEVDSVQTFTVAPVEASLNFAASQYQDFGMATSLAATAGNYWALFDTGNTSNTLFADVNVNGATQTINLGALPVGFHTYRIQPSAGAFQFLVDGVLKATSNPATFPGGTNLKMVLFAYSGSSAFQADWVRVNSYPSTGTFTSSVFNALSAVTWNTASWTATLPSGTTITVQTRTGNTATPDNSWSAWTSVANGGAISSPAGQYVQYRVILSTADPTVTPTLTDITLTWL